MRRRTRAEASGFCSACLPRAVCSGRCAKYFEINQELRRGSSGYPVVEQHGGVKATDSSESVSRRETCLCGEAEAISEDSAKMQAIQMAPFVTEPARIHTAASAIRLRFNQTRSYTNYSYLRPAALQRDSQWPPTGWVSLTNSRSLWNISSREKSRPKQPTSHQLVLGHIRASKQ